MHGNQNFHKELFVFCFQWQCKTIDNTENMNKQDLFLLKKYFFPSKSRISVNSRDTPFLIQFLNVIILKPWNSSTYAQPLKCWYHASFRLLVGIPENHSRSQIILIRWAELFLLWPPLSKIIYSKSSCIIVKLRQMHQDADPFHPQPLATCREKKT